MIKFINIRGSNKDFPKYTKLTSGDASDLQNKLSKYSEVVITNITKDCALTDKGRHRLVDYLNAIVDYGREVVVGYDPLMIKYLLKTTPTKIYSWSTKFNQKVSALSDERCTILEYNKDTEELLPTDFIDSKAMFEWLVSTDPTNVIDVINEIKAAKANPEINLQNTDLKYFEELVPTISELHKTKGFSKQTLINAFLTLGI